MCDSDNDIHLLRNLSKTDRINPPGIDLETLLSSDLIKEDLLYSELLILMEAIENPSILPTEKYGAIDELVITYKIMFQILRHHSRPPSDAIESFHCDIKYLRREGFYEKITAIDLDDFDFTSDAAQKIVQRLINREMTARVLDSCIETNIGKDKAKIMRSFVSQHPQPDLLLNDFLTNLPNLDTESQALFLVQAFQMAGAQLIVLNPDNEDLSASLTEMLKHCDPSLLPLRPDDSAFRFFLPLFGQSLINARWFTVRKVADLLYYMPGILPFENFERKEAIFDALNHWHKWEIKR